MACRRRHNYILDQSNVSRDARKRKLTQFKDFQRKCVVIIPNEDEHERRLLKQSRQADSMQIPAEAMLEMKGLYLLLPVVNGEGTITNVTRFPLIHSHCRCLRNIRGSIPKS